MKIDAPRPHHFPALWDLWIEAFGDTEAFLRDFERTAFDPMRCRCVIQNDTMAAALYWFDCSYPSGRVAYLYAIATAKAYRGQGLCRALLEDTHRHLKALGYVAAILVPSDEGLFDFYRKMGYQTATHIGEICAVASTHPLQMREVGIEEYARLRQKFLPHGGVIQEGENLRFLQTMARFYAGDDLLLTARLENGFLDGIELLGNTAFAPDIVCALGCAEGHFRVPDAKTPFSMYYPLLDGVKSPSYFGLAFD
jgi:ribosomal protein S18 acetylase RimI-like enzyme